MPAAAASWPTVSRSSASWAVSPGVCSMARTGGRRRAARSTRGARQPLVDPVEQVAGDLVAVGLVEDLVPRVRVDVLLDGQASVAEQAGEGVDLARLAAAHRVAPAGQQQLRETVGELGDRLLRAGTHG